jgi:hypothetical protein
MSCPKNGPNGQGLVRVRSLRTQQRTNLCRCQINPRPRWFWPLWPAHRGWDSFGKAADAKSVALLGFIFLHMSTTLGFGLGVSIDINGEFDPGSGRTLAACLTHASRAERPLRGYSSGERVSNTWVTCPWLWDKPGKLGLIPDMTRDCMVRAWKGFRPRMDSRPIS